MKTIGIIGGLGPESTVDYYNLIIEAFKKGDLNYPEIIIYSVNLGEFISLMKAKKFDVAAEKIAQKINSLKKAGAEYAAITANTPHMLFNMIAEKTDLPLISIVEATCSECMKMGLKRTGLMGTGFTMNSTFYQDVFKKHGIEVIMPEDDDKEIINNKLFTEIELGIFKDDTRHILISIIEKMKLKNEIDSIILGCTEFPLILKEPSYAGLPVLNTTKIHVDSIVKYCRED